MCSPFVHSLEYHESSYCIASCDEVFVAEDLYFFIQGPRKLCKRCVFSGEVFIDSHVLRACNTFHGGGGRRHTLGKQVYFGRSAGS